MIERLTKGLRRLASLSVRDLGDVAGARLLGDCADAVTPAAHDDVPSARARRR